MDKSNNDLLEFLETCDNETMKSLILMIKSFFSDEKGSEIQKYLEEIPSPESSERKHLAQIYSEHLRYFGSDSVAYVFRKIFRKEAGISYKDIVYDVSKLLKKSLKSKIEIPRVAKLEDYEYKICEMLLQNVIKGKSEIEIRELLSDANLDEDAIKEFLKTINKYGIAGVGLIGLVKILGKKTVSVIINKIIVWFVAKRLGKEAAEELAKQILKGVAQKTIGKIVSGIGSILLAYDVIKLAGPGTRITLPVISLISSVRVARRLT